MKAADSDRRTLRSMTACAALLAAVLAGCAARPANDVRELLDEATGTTLTRLASPVELTTTAPRGANADPFAYVAPFETNRMGRRERWLWIAVPDERGDALVPTLAVGGEEVVLGSAVDSRSTGLLSPPYREPAPWSAQHVFRLDDAALAMLASGGSWRVRVERRDGTPLEFAGTATPADLLRRFAERTGATPAAPAGR
ncbi:MAG: hypothetical protein R3E65_07250 [Steroidobacteraceae bacterium]